MYVRRSEPLFPLGLIVVTTGALDLLDRTGTNGDGLLRRHGSGDWGVVCAADARSNDLAVTHGTRLLSAYELGDRRERLWVITEANRRATTLLLPFEY